jgi:ElaB/YqjD/DUF883 family membrane-anchored ribosome-binding protein
MADAGDALSERAAQVKDKVSDMARTAADTIDKRRSTAADGLETAASTLHEKAGSLPGGERVNELARTAAEQLSSTADYVRTHNVSRMMTDVETLVKNNPGPSLVAAAVFGFLVGRAMIRD